MDKLTPAQRHKNMQAVKNKDSDIELILRKQLWNNGLHYRKNVAKLIGKPDIVFFKYKLAIFCDSEFWHGYNWNKSKCDIHSNQDFWYKKIERNIERDSEVTAELQKQGWTVLRFWGNEILKHPTDCLNKIISTIESLT